MSIEALRTGGTMGEAERRKCDEVSEDFMADFMQNLNNIQNKFLNFKLFYI